MDLPGEIECEGHLRRRQTAPVEETKKVNSVKLNKEMITVPEANQSFTKATDETYESLRGHAKSEGIEF